MSESKRRKKGVIGSMALAMIQCGILGFGGGNALIPVLYEKLVKENRFVDEKEFNEAVVVATIMPGASPVEIASGVGQRVRGGRGMLLAAGAISLPGCLLTFLLAALLSSFGAAVTRQINFLSIGVSAYIMYVLICYVLQTVDQAKAEGSRGTCLFLIAAVFLLTCGKQLYELFGIDRDPVFGVATISAMATAFFLIFWLRDSKSPKRLIPGGIIAVLYCLCAGKMQLFAGTPVKTVLMLLMLLMAVWGLYADMKGDGIRLQAGLKSTLSEVGLSLLFIAVCAVPALLACGETWPFLWRGALSSLLSFGGGDAYLAVAGGMFVTTGLVLYADFYSNLVPVANALPGSILCKLLTGMGYFVGFRASGSAAVGVLTALCGFGTSVGMSCLTYSVGAWFYAQMEHVSVFDQIKRSIRPIVCGLLLTVVLGLLYNCVQIGQEQAWHGGIAPVLCLALLGGCFLYVRRFRYRPLKMVALSAVLSLAVCNALMLL